MTIRPGAMLASGSAALIAALPAQAQPIGETLLETVQDLSGLSIEELAQITVRSASKREEPLSAAPAALFVITNEDILSSAATSIREALRLAPNLQVQQIDARAYSISARGFNGTQSANKLLVLLDGRTIYSPLASSVFWELHNRPLDEIAQIEVISGPGGTLYGPNAVNGVVNILTHDARDTIGGLVRATAGDQERALSARFGAALGTSGAVRVYGHAWQRDDLPAGPVVDIDDRFRGWQAGFRSDFGFGNSHFTFQGDLFDTDASADPALAADGDHGFNLLARWTERITDGSTLRVQAYYDYFRRDALLVRDSLRTVDLEAQYNLLHGRHDIVLGGGLRTTRDEVINNLNAFQLNPSSRRLWVYNAFIQDRFAISPELSLIAGLKVEETTFTGIELLPNLRVSWQPNPRTLAWAAVSRAVRTPSRIDRQLEAPPLLEASTNFMSEKLVAFEAGYRGQPTDRTTLSVSVFYNVYDDLRSTEFSPGFTLPIRLLNGYEGHSYGLEAWSSTQLASWWRLNLGVATLWKDFEIAPGRLDAAAGRSLGRDPNYQLTARSRMNLTDALQLDAGLRWVDDLGGVPVGSYAEADARLAYELTENLELYVAGRNLLHSAHLESGDVDRAQLAERSLFAGTRIRF